jgi:hypothetical protein
MLTALFTREAYRVMTFEEADEPFGVPFVVIFDTNTGDGSSLIGIIFPTE